MALRTTTKASWLAVALGMATFAAIACSSKNNTSCLEATVSSACYSCLQSHCSQELATYNTSCADFLSCLCPGGTYDPSVGASCASDRQEPGCSSAASAGETCQNENCAVQCAAQAGDGGADAEPEAGSGSSSGSSGGSSSGSSSGGATGPTGECGTLTMCCALLPPGSKAGCEAQANSGDQSGCMALLDSYDGDGGPCQLIQKVTP
jgi:uncharacterized membrane protein YgcG